jgi:hypothetical protein
MPEKKTKDCARCGLEFTFERSTAKYCSENCRRYVNITKQRKRIKRNTDRRILRDLQRRWDDLEGRRAQHDCKRYDLMVDAESGCSFARERLEQLERTLQNLKPYWDRDERTLRKDAEKLGVEWGRVTGKDTPVKKPKKQPSPPTPAPEREPTHEVTAGPRTMSYTPDPNRKPMVLVATTRKRKRVTFDQ